MATSRTEEEDTMTSTLAWHTQFVGENSMLFKATWKFSSTFEMEINQAK